MTDITFGLSPNHTMEIEKRRGELGFQGQPQKIVLLGTSKSVVSVADKFTEIENIKTLTNRS